MLAAGWPSQPRSIRNEARRTGQRLRVNVASGPPRPLVDAQITTPSRRSVWSPSVNPQGPSPACRESAGTAHTCGAATSADTGPLVTVIHPGEYWKLVFQPERSEFVRSSINLGNALPCLPACHVALARPPCATLGRVTRQGCGCVCRRRRRASSARGLSCPRVPMALSVSAAR